jgi:hypothetical protein
MNRQGESGLPGDQDERLSRKGQSWARLRQVVRTLGVGLYKDIC